MDDQIDDNGGVDRENHDLRGRQTVDEFINLERDQAGGGDDGEVFGPSFSKQESSAFGE